MAETILTRSLQWRLINNVAYVNYKLSHAETNWLTAGLEVTECFDCRSESERLVDYMS